MSCCIPYLVVVLLLFPRTSGSIRSSFGVCSGDLRAEEVPGGLLPALHVHLVRQRVEADHVGGVRLEERQRVVPKGEAIRRR